MDDLSRATDAGRLPIERHAGGSRYTLKSALSIAGLLIVIIMIIYLPLVNQLTVDGLSLSALCSLTVVDESWTPIGWGRLASPPDCPN